MRYLFIERHQPVWPVIRMCEVLDVSTQGYYAWRGREPSQRTLFNAGLDEAIARIYWQHKGR